MAPLAAALPPKVVPLAVFTASAVDRSRESEVLFASTPPPFVAEEATVVEAADSFVFEHWAAEEGEEEELLTFWLPAGVRTPFGGAEGELARERRPRVPTSSPPPPPPPRCLPPTTISPTRASLGRSRDD